MSGLFVACWFLSGLLGAHVMEILDRKAGMPHDSRWIILGGPLILLAAILICMWVATEKDGK